MQKIRGSAKEFSLYHPGIPGINVKLLKKLQRPFTEFNLIMFSYYILFSQLNFFNFKSINSSKKSSFDRKIQIWFQRADGAQQMACKS